MKWERRIVRGALLAGILAVIGTIAGCAGGPPELEPGEEPVLEDVPTDARLETDDSLQGTIDPGGLTGRVESVEVVIALLPGETIVREWSFPVGSPDGASTGVSEQSDGRLSVAVPLEGLEDGNRYLVRYALILIDGARYPFSATSTIELRLGLPVPVPLADELVTLDRRQPFLWSLPSPAAVGTALVRYRAASGEVELVGDSPSGPVVPTEPLVEREAFDRGEVVEWQARTVSSRGVLGRWSREARLRFDVRAAVPIARAHAAGLPSVTAVPALSWDRVAGAQRYRLHVWMPAGGPTVPAVPPTDLPVEVEIEVPFFRLDAAVLELLFAEADNRAIAWRVAAVGAEGVITPFSDVHRLLYAPIVGGVETTLPVGAVANLELGSDNAPEQDERPAAVVRITRPFAMMRHELTNGAVVALVAAEVAAGRMVVEDGAVRDAEDRTRVLIGLGELDFGAQFGLVEQSGSVTVADGYVAHPAVGVSWYGAVALANALSVLEGRETVAVQSRSMATGETDRFVGPGYRVPSEAEWALAVAVTRRIGPGEETEIREARVVPAVEMRGINYERSGDRWEDPVPPYTREGGPTSAVGALGFPSPVGISDLLGNVWEWTADWYDPEWYAAVAAGEVDPTEASEGPGLPVLDIYGRELRSVRGTAWNTPREAVRPGNRGGFAPDATSHSIGVRLVRTLR